MAEPEPQLTTVVNLKNDNPIVMKAKASTSLIDSLIKAGVLDSVPETVKYRHRYNDVYEDVQMFLVKKDFPIGVDFDVLSQGEKDLITSKGYTLVAENPDKWTQYI